jgi:ABC-type uncharacterized transport system fused permease/ATPase subunit
MFRLLSVKINSHPQLGDVDINFLELEHLKNNEKPFTSVIIGPNGTGKSFILRAIAEIFRSLASAKADEKKAHLSYDYHIRYTLNKSIYEIISRITPMVPARGRRMRRISILKNYPQDQPIFDESKKAVLEPKI